MRAAGRGVASVLGAHRPRRSAGPVGRTARVSDALLIVGIAAASCTVEPRTDANRQPLAGTETAPRREVVQPEGVARLPVFSTAIRTGDLLFLSGQIGTIPGVSPPQVVAGGIEAETRQTLENIVTVLEADGLGLGDVVKCTVFLADIDDYAAMNGVYLEFFGGDPPARSAMAGSGLALGARVEIECIAAYPEGR